MPTYVCRFNTANLPFRASGCRKWVSVVAVHLEVKLRQFFLPISLTIVANVVIFVSKREREREKSFRNEYNFIIYKVARNIFIVSKFPSRFYHFFSPFFTLHTRGSLKILSRPRVKAVNFSRIVIPTTRVSVLLHNAATVRTRKSRECFVPRCVEILPILFPIERIKRFVRTFTRSSKKKKKELVGLDRSLAKSIAWSKFSTGQDRAHRSGGP